MECDSPFDLLHHLVNTAVEHGDGPEPLQQIQGLLAVSGSPSPFGIRRPQRNVRENTIGRLPGCPLRSASSQLDWASPRWPMPSNTAVLFKPTKWTSL